MMKVLFVDEPGWSYPGNATREEMAAVLGFDPGPPEPYDPAREGLVVESVTKGANGATITLTGETPMTPEQKRAVYERAEGICVGLEAARAPDAAPGPHPVNTGSRVAWLTASEYARFKYLMRQPDATGATPRAPNRHERRAMAKKR